MNFNLSMREKVLLVALGLVIIIFGGAKLLIIPASESLRNDSQELASTSTKVVEAQNYVAQSKNIDKSVEKALSDAKDSARPLFPSLDKPSLHLWLLSIAAQTNVGIDSMSISDPVASTPLSVTTGSTESTESKEQSSGSAEQSSSVSTNTSNMDNYAKVYLNTASSANGKSGSDTTSAQVNVSSSAAGDAMMSNVTLRLSGNYNNIEAFIDKIKASNRCIIVRSLRLETTQEGFKSEITLQFYGATKLDDSDKIFEWKAGKPQGKADLM